MHEWIPLVLSGAAAIVSGVAVVCVAIIGWLIRYVFTSVDRRVVDLEKKTGEHASHIAGAVAQSVAEEKIIKEMSGMINDMREKVEALTNQIAVLVGSLPKTRRKQ